MRAFNIVILSSLAVAAIAGCSSGSDHMNNSDHMQNSSADYKQDRTYMADTSSGAVMTSPEGMTVYTFDMDQAGTSACYGDCAAKWPPVLGDGSAQEYGQMSLITRTDGQKQWAYGGKPLYTYHDDAGAGDVKGDNVGGVWHVVK